MLWPGTHPVRRLRHLSRQALFIGHPAWRRALLLTIATIAWPIGSVWETAKQVRRLPKADRPSRLWGHMRRAGHMLLLAWRDNVPPRNYVAYRLHDPARRAWIDAGFYEPEVQALMGRLNRLREARADDVQDKARFADLCRAHGLPCIPTLAVFRSGAQAVPETPFLPVQPDLWVKDLAGSRGSGAARWLRDGEVYRHGWTGEVLLPSELVARWRGQDCIVQPCLHDHPSLKPCSDGSLVVLRVITGVGRSGRATLVDTLAQLPYGGTAGGHVFATLGPDGDIRTPRLRGRHPIGRHPDSGAVLDGATVPFWCEARALVLRAHADVPEFARFVFLGWDVAITAEGPVLIETNVGWSEFNHQLGEGLPLGLTALTSIALDHLDDRPRCA